MHHVLYSLTPHVYLQLTHIVDKLVSYIILQRHCAYYYIGNMAVFNTCTCTSNYTVDLVISFTPSQHAPSPSVLLSFPPLHHIDFKTCSPFLCAHVYQNNTTPLYVACQNGHHDVVQTLLGAGADVSVAKSKVSDV